MKLFLHHQSVPSTNDFDLWVEHQIGSLRSRLRIDEASVRLACRPGSSPAFEVNVHLVTPGPDVLAAGRDHTLPAAFAKVMTRLRAKIRERTVRRWQRVKSNLPARHGRRENPRTQAKP